MRSPQSHPEAPSPQLGKDGKSQVGFPPSKRGLSSCFTGENPQLAEGPAKEAASSLGELSPEVGAALKLADVHLPEQGLLRCNQCHPAGVGISGRHRARDSVFFKKADFSFPLTD